jgi:hypothetical protein
MHPHPHARLTAVGRAQILPAVEASVTASAVCTKCHVV